MSWGLRICRYCQHESSHWKQWPGLAFVFCSWLLYVGLGVISVGWYQLRGLQSPQPQGQDQECSYTMNALNESKSKLHLWQLLKILQSKDLTTKHKIAFKLFNSAPYESIPWLVIKLSLCVSDGVCVPGCPQEGTERWRCPAPSFLPTSSSEGQHSNAFTPARTSSYHPVWFVRDAGLF